MKGSELDVSSATFFFFFFPLNLGQKWSFHFLPKVRGFFFSCFVDIAYLKNILWVCMKKPGVLRIPSVCRRWLHVRVGARSFLTCSACSYAHKKEILLFVWAAKPPTEEAKWWPTQWAIGSSWSHLKQCDDVAGTFPLTLHSAVPPAAAGFRTEACPWISYLCAITGFTFQRAIGLAIES